MSVDRQKLLDYQLAVRMPANNLVVSGSDEIFKNKLLLIMNCTSNYS